MANVLTDRFRGLMAGTAVGDCVGRPYEGRRATEEQIEGLMGGVPPPLIYTDDTAMTIALAESLLECDGFEGAHMSMRFATQYRESPHRGYGSGITRIFEQVLSGVDWEEASRSQFGGSGSFGNGSAMRVAPVALWAHPDIEETARLAAETSRVTHTHPIGVDGAVVQAVAAHHALILEPGAQPDVDALLTDLNRWVHTPEFGDALRALPGLVEEPDDERAISLLGNGIAADRSVVTALYCYLTGDTFTDVIRRCLRVGGDTDTIAAMAGAQAGARFGLEVIPPRWHMVEGCDELVALADRMHERVPR
jgi:poly(ADP-ribose) glycohydrolase ARH3